MPPLKKSTATCSSLKVVAYRARLRRQVFMRFLHCFQKIQSGGVLQLSSSLTLSPKSSALVLQDRTLPHVAVAFVVSAWVSIHVEAINRTLMRDACAQFWQITVMLSCPAYCSCSSDLLSKEKGPPFPY